MCVSPLRMISIVCVLARHTRVVRNLKRFSRELFRRVSSVRIVYEMRYCVRRVRAYVSPSFLYLVKILAVLLHPPPLSSPSLSPPPLPSTDSIISLLLLLLLLRYQKQNKKKKQKDQKLAFCRFARDYIFARIIITSRKTERESASSRSHGIRDGIRVLARLPAGIRRIYFESRYTRIWRYITIFRSNLSRIRIFSNHKDSISSSTPPHSELL